MKKAILALGVILLFASCKKDIPQKQLTVNVTPGVGGSVTPKSGTYAMGSNVVLLATPSAEYIFKEWTGEYSGTTNPANVVMDADKVITAVFEKRQYPLSLTIVGSGTVKEEIIKIASSSTNYTSGTTVRLTPQPSAGFQFKKWSGDDTSSKSPLDLVISKSINLSCTFEKMAITSLKIENPIDSLIISKKHKYLVKGIYSDGSTIDLSDSVKITASTSGITLLSDKSIVGAKSGNIVNQISYNNLSITDEVYVNSIEFIAIDSKFKSSGKGKVTVPVVIINYLPTNDGVFLDMLRAPDGYYDINNSTLERAKSKIFGDKIIEKNVIEEGTRYRDYATNKVDPYISIDVVAYINVYELEYAPNPDGNPIQIINWEKLFPRLGIKNYVENSGVKEIWFTAFPKEGYPSVLKQPNPTDKSLWYNMPESNMSSPITGDVSNSSRYNKDLPIYSKTYVVYGFNAHRGADTDLHNRGHQIEAQLSYIDRELIWNNAFLPTSTKKEFRLGNCHWPPNATADYDYGNKIAVKSDIASYQPSGGTFIDVNVDTWLGKNYTFPMIATNIVGESNYANDAQVKWFIYWWQSIPGHNNTVPYNNTILENWWDIFYNWDDAIKANKKLYK
ncbi:MAG: InlB B-repeat-containing protein [Sediminibacterium sp.]